MAKISSRDAILKIESCSREVLVDNKKEIHYLVKNTTEAEFVEGCLNQLFEHNAEQYIKHIVIEGYAG